LITSCGPWGENVMAAEWTMQISYDPMLMAIFIHEGTATFENIKKTKEFGINVSTDEQATAVNIAGGYSRKELDKLKIKNAFNMIPSRKINPPSIAGCIINVECKLVTMKKFGDHIMVIGKAVEISYDESKKPLIYHTGRYFRLGLAIESFRKIINVDETTFEWFSAESRGKFVLKGVGLVIKSNNKILVLNHSTKNNSYTTIPYLVPKRGTDHKKTLDSYVKKVGLKVTVNKIPTLKRLVLRNKKKVMRINFVLFEGKIRSDIRNHMWQSIKSNSLLSGLTV